MQARRQEENRQKRGVFYRSPFFILLARDRGAELRFMSEIKRFRAF